MKSLIPLAVILLSVVAVLAEESYEDRSKLEQMIRKLSYEENIKLYIKVQKLLDSKRSVCGDDNHLHQTCLQDKPIRELIKEAPCCKEYLLLENLEFARQIFSMEMTFPTDDVDLFKDLF